jgi:hypothetical protein
MRYPCYNSQTTIIEVSGFSKVQKTEHRKQMTEDKGQTIICLLSSDLCSLLSDT